MEPSPALAGCVCGGSNGVGEVGEEQVDARGTEALGATGRGGAGAGAAVVSPVTLRCALHYNMRHPKRGMALIFNHETFASPALKQRQGTNVDCDALAKTLGSLGFAVTVKRDLPFSGVRDYIAMMAAADHSAFDCMVVVVLSHGELGRLHAYDTYYKPDLLWHSFTADKCPSLAGKPKLFFVQACQGEELDPGVRLRDRTETDGHHSDDYKIPVHADFLIAYSTVPGYFSWRNTTRGSWFIQALVEELRAHATTRDILTLLTFVNQKVALNYESNTPDCPVMHQQKQISCFSSMLTRMLVFVPKT